MIELRVLGVAGRSLLFPLSALPISGGRNAASMVALSGIGIWESHFRIELDPDDGVVVQSMGDAFTAVDGQRIARRRLRNGDVIACGEARLQFWLAPAPQRSLRLWEACVWVVVVIAALAQMAVANWIGR